MSTLHARPLRIRVSGLDPGTESLHGWVVALRPRCSNLPALHVKSVHAVVSLARRLCSGPGQEAAGAESRREGRDLGGGRGAPV